METYNGWTNYETWKINLEFLDGRKAEDIWEQKCKPELVQDYIEEIAHYNIGNLFALSCVNSFLSAVNWHEIAEHLNED